MTGLKCEKRIPEVCSQTKGDRVWRRPRAVGCADTKSIADFRNHLVHLRAARGDAVKLPFVGYAHDAIPGIGPFIALLLVAEIGAIERFPSPKPLASYTGLVPSLYASGEHRWGGAITKQGSTLLRWAWVQAAHQAARSARFSADYPRPRERLGLSPDG